MRVVCISDTHGLHDELLQAHRIPDGDVLIHAGDFTDTGDRDEVLAFNAFLAALPHKHKLVIAGNHESSFDRAFYPSHWWQYGHPQQYDPDEVRALLTNALYLEDQGVVIDGYVFYGSPWQPEFCEWAFNLPSDAALARKWALIPRDIDVLITHSPPFGHGDLVGEYRDQHVGCPALLEQVQTRIRPQVHVFGHVHESYGKSTDGVTVFANASSCTAEYEAINAPMVFDLAAPRMRAVSNEEGRKEARAWRYDVLLHEQLRACALKPAFVPVERPNGENNKAVLNDPTLRFHPHGPIKSLQQFQLEGTASALLFESTLRVRPLQGGHTRAMRYLFHRSSSKVSSVDPSNSDLQTPTASVASTSTLNGSGALAPVRADESIAARARRAGLSRRVTVAVLQDAVDRCSEMDQHCAVDNVNGVNREDPIALQAPRRRRVKGIQRRQCVSRLETMLEVNEETESGESTAPASADEIASNSSAEPMSTTPVPSPLPSPPPELAEVSPEPAASISPPTVDCVLCKFHVAGHVHPGTEPPPQAAAEPPPAQSAPAVECVLCKYHVAGHTHPGAAAPTVESHAGVQAGANGAAASASPDNANATDDAPLPLRRKRSVQSDRGSSWF